VAGGAVGVAGWAVWRRVPLLLCCDAAGLVLPVVQAIGRVGCQLAGDGDYGKPSHLPWAMAYPHGTVPTPPGVRVHPTPLYEIAALTVLAVWLWRRRDELRPGMAFALYLAGMGTERFLVEFVRRNSDVVAGLTLAQLTSIGCVAVGACWIALCVRGRAAFVRPPLAYAARPLGEHGTPARQRT
jgi:phosphatidylglycerol:prolipoprotein diacylglycerol transferase